MDDSHATGEERRVRQSTLSEQQAGRQQIKNQGQQLAAEQAASATMPLRREHVRQPFLSKDHEGRTRKDIAVAGQTTDGKTLFTFTLDGEERPRTELLPTDEEKRYILHEQREDVLERHAKGLIEGTRESVLQRLDEINAAQAEHEQNERERAQREREEADRKHAEEARAAEEARQASIARGIQAEQDAIAAREKAKQDAEKARADAAAAAAKAEADDAAAVAAAARKIAEEQAKKSRETGKGGKGGDTQKAAEGDKSEKDAADDLLG